MIPRYDVLRGELFFDEQTDKWAFRNRRFKRKGQALKFIRKMVK